MTIQNTITIDLRGNVSDDPRLVRADELAVNFTRAFGTMAGARRDGSQHIAARWDAANLPSMPGMRTDDVSSSMGMFGVRELEQRLGAVRQEVRRPLNAERLFSVDSSLNGNLQSYRIEREYSSGRAALHRAGAGQVNRVGIGKQEETRPIVTVAVGFDISIFDLGAAGYAGFNAQAALLRQCRVAIDEFANDAFWFGIPDADVYGVLDFPWTAKYVSAVSFTNANIAANPDAIIAELNFICQETANASGGAMAIDSIAMPIQLKNKLMSTPRSATTDTSLLNWWLNNNGYVTDASKVHGVHELADAGGADVDVVYAFSSDPEANKLIRPEAFNQLPVQEQDFNLYVPTYGRIGGFYAAKAANLIAYVDRV